MSSTVGDYAVEGFQLEKTFVKKRSLGLLIRHPFRRAERIRALRGVDLHVREGEIFGLLGPNGAGKTTLLKILSCLVLPDRGRAEILGEDTVNENRVKPRIGLVNTDERSFYWRLSGVENLRFFATLYDVPRRRVESRIAELLERVDIAHAATQRFSDYSSGMKQRLAIARALLHDPPVLLMDEPTRSLDPAVSRTLRRFIREDLQQRAGKTIVVATHHLGEAETLCDRLAILVKGKIRETGSPSQIRRWGVRERRYRIETPQWPEGLEGPFKIIARDVQNGTTRVTVSLAADSRLEDLLQSLLGAGVVLQACDRLEPDLEDAFARILEVDEEPAS